MLGSTSARAFTSSSSARRSSEGGKEGTDSMSATYREFSDDGVRAVVTRLARPHASGGHIIERAAIVAEGPDAVAIVAWIMAHDGQPEAIVPEASTRGLHGARSSGGRGADAGVPRRYVLPVGALS
jgi:hypothetical protein